MSRFSEDTVNSYKENSGVSCPCCGSEGDKEIVEYWFNGDSAECRIVCKECFGEWTEFYKLETIE